MTVDELGRTTKSKHPEYGSFSDSEVGARVLSKYPEYRSQIHDRPDVENIREQVEPGVMGETSPTGQRFLENAAIAGAGYAIPGAVQAVASIPKGIKSILGESKLPFIKSLGKNTRELGKEYDIQNEAIGVTRRLPPQGGMKPRYEPFERVAATKQPTPVVPAEPVPSNIPVRYPKDTGDFMAYANGRLSSPKPVSSQELMDWQVKLQTDMNNGVIPKFDQETKRITTAYQQASDLLSRTKSAFNKTAEPLLKETVIPKGVMKTREGLNKTFKYAANQEALIRGLKKAGKWGILAALGFGSGNAVLNKLTGR